MGKSLRKIILLFVILGTSFFAFRFTPLASFATVDRLLFFVGLVKNEWWGAAAFILIYGVACVVAIPGSVLTITGGVIFGLWPGTLYNLAGANLGAALAFLMARFLGRDFIAGLIKGKKLATFDEQVGKSGFATIFRLRLIPLVPFNGLNFGAGFSSVRFGDYLLASVFGMIPGCFIYTYFADSLLNGISEASRAAFLNLAFAGALLIGLSFLPAILQKGNWFASRKGKS